MKHALLFQALSKVTAGILLLGLLLFLPAGTLRWTNGWLLMGLLFIPMVIAGCILMKKRPDLLEKRLRMKEEQGEQKTVIALSGIMFVLSFIAAGLSYRFGLGQLPGSVTGFGAVLFLVSYALYGEVLRENAYISRVIEIQEGQVVVDTGLYGIVRHPMYAVTLVLFLSMPLILGSLPAFLILLIYPFLIAKRIRNEEAVLKEGLEGYRAYMEKVRWRMLPFIW